MADVSRPMRSDKKTLWSEYGGAMNRQLKGFPTTETFRPTVYRSEFNRNESDSHLVLQNRSGISKKKLWSGIGLIGVFVIGCFLLAHFLGALKNEIRGYGENGYADLSLAAEALKARHFSDALVSFERAKQDFSQAESRLPAWGSVAIDVIRFVPGLSGAASGKNALSAGSHFASAGASLARVAGALNVSSDAYRQGESVSLLHFLELEKEPLSRVTREMAEADQDLGRVNVADIPEDKRGKFLLVRENLPVMLGMAEATRRHTTLLRELLGENGPRKYLFLLQNNDEMRATGGFIGSYALLDVNDGKIRQFFVDGIFNPDGQLKENIVPPQPIQKISAAWSLHDSNWFPDFPTSAEKAIFFYEKTGGPTVDGVITLTPTVMQKLLAVTGPITLPKYGLSVDADNFIPVIQEQVEVKYDKTENKPKQVLADLSTALLEKVFASHDHEALYRIASALVEGLNEKHILLYVRHPETEALIDQAGWSGRLLPASKDFVSVIHSNINGYKTDGVIDETIRHRADIQSDGSIVDTLTITRTHRGGQTPYDWWNRVNADYLRVYVPLGAQLLSSKGATRELNEPPLAYDELGFKRVEDVVREENGMRVDEKSGTRLSTESGKTVFGNWVYVSPQESVTVEYRYLLPFHIDVTETRVGKSDSFSVLYQKQSGSLGSRLHSEIIFPSNLHPIWQTGANLVPYGRTLTLEETLVTDKYVGVVFGAGQ